MTLAKIFNLGDGGVLCLVGGGGKTTTMFRLAHDLAARGRRVITTTTTRILVPSSDESDHLLIAPSANSLLSLLANQQAEGRHLTAAAGRTGDDKLTGYSGDDIAMLAGSGATDWILVEADGAAGKPIKAPADHEPVVPACTTHFLGVIGLDCVGKPLTKHHVHRPDRYSFVTGLEEGGRITEVSIARLIVHPVGLFKSCPPGASRILLLNKTETSGRRNAAARIASRVRGLKPEGRMLVLAGSARDMPANVFSIVEV